VPDPVWGGLALFAMKTMMRTMNALPPMRRKFAKAQNEIRDRQRHAALEGLDLGGTAVEAAEQRVAA
jgi:hypothetical protein